MAIARLIDWIGAYTNNHWVATEATTATALVVSIALAKCS